MALLQFKKLPPKKNKRRFFGVGKLFEDIFKSFDPIDVIQKVFETFTYFWSSDMFSGPVEYSTAVEYSTTIFFQAQNTLFLTKIRYIFKINVLKLCIRGLEIDTKYFL